MSLPQIAFIMSATSEFQYHRIIIRRRTQAPFGIEPQIPPVKTTTTIRCQPPNSLGEHFACCLHKDFSRPHHIIAFQDESQEPIIRSRLESRDRCSVLKSPIILLDASNRVSSLRSLKTRRIMNLLYRPTRGSTGLMPLKL